MTQTQQQIEKLRTLQESLDFYADVAENQLPLIAKESTLQEESAAIQSKIDNIKLPEIDTTEFAKQGENQEATNSAILEGIERILARSVKYDTSTGNLQFDNIDLTIV